MDVAIGSESGDCFESGGWAIVPANLVIDVNKQPQKAAAEKSFRRRLCGRCFRQPLVMGTIVMGVGKQRFAIAGMTDCGRRSFVGAKFLETDTKAVERWTLFLPAPTAP